MRMTVFFLLVFISTTTHAFEASIDVMKQPKPKKILFIGDSHSVGTFGRTIDRSIRGLDGYQIATYASCGSRPRHWYTGWKTRCGYFHRLEDGSSVRKTRFKTPLITELLALHKPTHTIIALGANSHGLSREVLKKNATNMLQEIRASGSQCIWVGPPRRRWDGHISNNALNKTYKALQDITGDLCTLIDSRFQQVVYPPYQSIEGKCRSGESKRVCKWRINGDGVHYNFPRALPIARKWANLVLEEALSTIQQ